MNRKHILLIVALAASGSAAAADISMPGGASFPEPAPGASATPYRVAPLAYLGSNGDDIATRRLLSRADGSPARPAGSVSPGRAQLAASLGIDPAAFTLAELARLKFLSEKDSGDD